MLPPLLSGTSGIGAPMPVGCSCVMAGAWSCTICATALMAEGASTESEHAHTRNAVPETASVSQSAHRCGPSLSATGVLVKLATCVVEEASRQSACAGGAESPENALSDAPGRAKKGAISSREIGRAHV